MIRTCMKIGLLLAVVAPVAVFAHAFFVRGYEAKALLWMDDEQPYLVQPVENSRQDFVDNQLGLIRSPLVLEPVVSEPKIARLPELRTTELQGRQPAERLAELIDVSRAWGNQHYYVKCTTSNAKSSAEIVNAACRSYLALVEEYEAGRTTALIKRLNDEREVSEREVERLRENVRTMSLDQTGKDPFAAHADSEGTMILPLADLERQITSVKVERAVLKAQITALEEYLEDNPVEVTDAAIEEMGKRTIKQDALAERIESAIADRRFRIIELELAKETNGGKVETELSRLGKEIQLLQTKLSELGKELRQSLKVELTRSADIRRDAELAALREKLSNLHVQERALETAYEEELSQVKDFTGTTLELKIRKAELERAEKVMDRIAERAFRLRTEQRAPGRVSLVKPATVPASPVKMKIPFRRMILASLLAALAGFFVPLLIAWPITAIRRHNARVYQAVADEAAMHEQAQGEGEEPEEDDDPSDREDAAADNQKDDHPGQK